MANTITLKEINEMVRNCIAGLREAYDIEESDKGWLEDIDAPDFEEFEFTELKDKTYGTHIARFRDETDDQDLTEEICAWLSSHGITYECELCDDGYMEILINLK